MHDGFVAHRLLRRQAFSDRSNELSPFVHFSLNRALLCYLIEQPVYDLWFALVAELWLGRIIFDRNITSPVDLGNGAVTSLRRDWQGLRQIDLAGELKRGGPALRSSYALDDWIQLGRPFRDRGRNVELRLVVVLRMDPIEGVVRVDSFVESLPKLLGPDA